MISNKDETTTHVFLKNNSSRRMELKLNYNLLFTHYVWSHCNSRRWKDERNTIRYKLNQGGFYKILSPINVPMEWPYN